MHLRSAHAGWPSAATEFHNEGSVMRIPSGVDPATLVLSNDEIRRYSRHLIMPEVTLTGQQRLKAASVLCIGTGGLGSRD